MPQALANDLDYLATRLHARRSRMAEGARLDELCRLPSLPELGQAILPGVEINRTADFQRRLLENLAWEMAGCLKHLDGGAQELVSWQLARLQLENAKVLLRGFLNHTPLESLQPHLIRLPPGLAWESPGWLEAAALPEFAARLPAGEPRRRLRAVIARERDLPPLLLEGALDSGYFEELLARASRLDNDEAEIAKPMIAQEVSQFQFLLVLRGKFHFDLPTAALAPLQIMGNRGGAAWWEQLLSAPDAISAATIGVGVVIDALPAAWRTSGTSSTPDLSLLETLAWQRFARLANAAFRRSHLGAAAVAAYFNLRRLEIANLITLSEGLRLGLDERVKRARLIPRTDLEVSHV